jgi:hypothetical protein
MRCDPLSHPVLVAGPRWRLESPSLGKHKCDVSLLTKANSVLKQKHITMGPLHYEWDP